MADAYWSGLGVAAGTAISSGNINTAGNHDSASSVSWSGTGTTATYARQSAPVGNGASITGTAGNVGRIDMPHTTGRGQAVQLLYTPSATPTTADQAVIAGRTASGFSLQVFHRTTGTIRFTNATNTPITSGETPTLVNGHTYQIDVVVAQNSGTRTTTNGRFICRVISLSSNSWNTTGEWFLDTGYTNNAETADLTQVRVGKTTSGANVGQAYYTGIRWGDRPSVNTSTDPTTARTNFISSTETIDAGTAPLSVTPSLTGTPVELIASATTIFTSVAVTVASATEEDFGLASLSVTPSLVSVSTRDLPAATSISVTPTLTSTVAEVALGVASLTVVPTLSASAIAEETTNTTLSLTPSLSSAAIKTAVSTATLSVTPTLTTNAVRIHDTTIAITSNLSLTSSSIEVVTALTTINTTPLLTANIVKEQSLSASLSLTPVFSSVGIEQAIASSNLTVTPTLTSTTTRTQPLSASLSTTPELSVVSGGTVVSGSSALSLIPDFTATGVREVPTSISLSLTVTLSSTASETATSSSGMSLIPSLSATSIRTAVIYTIWPGEQHPGETYPSGTGVVIQALPMTLVVAGGDAVATTTLTLVPSLEASPTGTYNLTIATTIVPALVVSDSTREQLGVANLSLTSFLTTSVPVKELSASTSLSLIPLFTALTDGETTGTAALSVVPLLGVTTQVNHNASVTITVPSLFTVAGTTTVALSTVALSTTPHLAALIGGSADASASLSLAASLTAGGVGIDQGIVSLLVTAILGPVGAGGAGQTAVGVAITPSLSVLMLSDRLATSNLLLLPTLSLFDGVRVSQGTVSMTLAATMIADLALLTLKLPLRSNGPQAGRGLSVQLRDHSEGFIVTQPLNPSSRILA